MKMIANREQCLEPAALNDLLLGRLPPERFVSALQHVESCEGLHDSRPAAFRKFFLEDLEQSANIGLNDLYIGGLDATCERWYYAILKPLIEHPLTRDRAIAAIEKIVKHLPNDKKHFLEDLLK